MSAPSTPPKRTPQTGDKAQDVSYTTGAEPEGSADQQGSPEVSDDMSATEDGVTTTTVPIEKWIPEPPFDSAEYLDAPDMKGYVEGASQRGSGKSGDDKESEDGEGDDADKG